MCLGRQQKGRISAYWEYPHAFVIKCSTVLKISLDPKDPADFIFCSSDLFRDYVHLSGRRSFVFSFMTPQAEYESSKFLSINCPILSLLKCEEMHPICSIALLNGTQACRHHLMFHACGFGRTGEEGWRIKPNTDHYGHSAHKVQWCLTCNPMV